MPKSNKNTSSQITVHKTESFGGYILHNNDTVPRLEVNTTANLLPVYKTKSKYDAVSVTIPLDTIKQRDFEVHMKVQNYLVELKKILLENLGELVNESTEIKMPMRMYNQKHYLKLRISGNPKPVIYVEDNHGGFVADDDFDFDRLDSTYFNCCTSICMDNCFFSPLKNQLSINIKPRGILLEEDTGRGVVSEEEKESMLEMFTS